MPNNHSYSWQHLKTSVDGQAREAKLTYKLERPMSNERQQALLKRLYGHSSITPTRTYIRGGLLTVIVWEDDEFDAERLVEGVMKEVNQTVRGGHYANKR